MIEARFGFKRRPFDKSLASRDLYLWPGPHELEARLKMVKLAKGILLKGVGTWEGDVWQEENASWNG